MTHFYFMFVFGICRGFFFKPLLIETCVRYFHFPLTVLIADEIFLPEFSSSLVSFLLSLLFSF